MKGRCLNHLTNGPDRRESILRCFPSFGSGDWIRTGDTSGMNRMLWPTELRRQIVCPNRHGLLYQTGACLSISFLKKLFRKMRCAEKCCPDARIPGWMRDKTAKTVQSLRKKKAAVRSVAGNFLKNIQKFPCILCIFLRVCYTSTINHFKKRGFYYGL